MPDMLIIPSLLLLFIHCQSMLREEAVSVAILLTQLNYYTIKHGHNLLLFYNYPRPHHTILDFNKAKKNYLFNIGLLYMLENND